MKVLWISPNGGNYKHALSAGTGGWIGALQEEITRIVPEMELGITFLSATDTEVIQEGRVIYYPVKISAGGGRIKSLFSGYFSNKEKEDNNIAKAINRIIEKFQPDLVHVWGIEGRYANVIPLIKCPFVVHIQGLASLSIYKHMPNGYSTFDLFKADFPLRWILKKGSYQRYKDVCHIANREVELAKYVNNWIGRTEYDRVAANLLHPDSHYFHCEEIMWNGFYGKKWEYHYDKKKIVIQSSIRSGWLKGFDIILYTAQLLKQMGVPVEWRVFGIERSEYHTSYTIKKLNINPSDVGVFLYGNVERDVICNSLLQSDVYVHTSYIENSSNAIAEAMMLGVPTVAQYVGGNPSMLKDNSGKLVALNEPYAMAGAIMDMRDKCIAEGYSVRALAVSSQRQDTGKTVRDLIEIYNKIVNGNDAY